MKKKFICLLSIICFIVCSFKIITNYIFITKTTMKYGNLSDYKNEYTNSEQTLPDTDTQMEANNNLYDLNKINNNLVGWLSIEKTNIDYPIVQTNNNDYYLSHDFWNNYSPAGVPFIDFQTNLSSNNMIIYGHNMKNGTMFSNLTQYKNEDFYKEHPIIKFETLKSCNYYKIVSILLIDVNDLNSLSFTDFISSHSKEYLLNLIITKSLINTGETVNENNKFITLCTCYGKKSNRLLIIAKQI